ncbi:MAG: hypothetical protein HC767_03355 [Akkermansiaceae bacterium]|nr:hypothetical protein [Akkermansiaceae bacterium]
MWVGLASVQGLPHNLHCSIVKHCVPVQGEPVIVQVAWATLAASFSFSLATTVWGRAGL